MSRRCFSPTLPPTNHVAEAPCPFPQPPFGTAVSVGSAGLCTECESGVRGNHRLGVAVGSRRVDSAVSVFNKTSEENCGTIPYSVRSIYRVNPGGAKRGESTRWGGCACEYGSVQWRIRVSCFVRAQAEVPSFPFPPYTPVSLRGAPGAAHSAKMEITP